MKKIIFLFLAVSIFACDDGDFDVPSFDFKSTINVCDEYVLYRLGNGNSNEALIVTLKSTDIPNEIVLDGDNIQIGLLLDATRTITYRIFDSSVTSSYFCTDIPPTTPIIIKSWEATAGAITIESSEVFDSFGVATGELSHKITFTNLVLTNGNETLPYDVFEFGSVKIIPTI